MGSMIYKGVNFYLSQNSYRHADKESTGLWNEYVSRYHYLGYKQPFGYFLRYFVESEQGLLGCILFAGAAKALREKQQGQGLKVPVKAVMPNRKSE